MSYSYTEAQMKGNHLYCGVVLEYRWGWQLRRFSSVFGLYGDGDRELCEQTGRTELRCQIWLKSPCSFCLFWPEVSAEATLLPFCRFLITAIVSSSPYEHIFTWRHAHISLFNFILMGGFLQIIFVKSHFKKLKYLKNEMPSCFPFILENIALKLTFIDQWIKVNMSFSHHLVLWKSAWRLT